MQTLRVWLQEWIRVYAPLRCSSLKTIERYRQLAAYVCSGPSELLNGIAEKPLPEVTHRELESGILSLWRAQGKRRNLSARTVRHIAGLLSVTLQKAFVMELIPENPMRKVELPRLQWKQARGLTPDQIHALREVCRGEWIFPFVELALATGCRRGELLALEWTDIDWEHGSVAVSKSLEQTQAGLRIKGTKNERPRACRLPQAAIAALSEHRATAAGELLFPNKHGGYYHPDLVSQIIVRRLRKAGIRNASLHTLRHAHASNLLSRGVPLPAVSARLGHADAHITAKIYSHALPADDQRAADEWDSLLSR